MARTPRSRVCSRRATPRVVALVALVARCAIGVVACFAASGCGASEPFQTATELPKQKRKPDGVFVDTPAAVPSAADRATAAGHVALREPIREGATNQVVRAFFAAFEREDIGELQEMLAPGAAVLAPGRPGSPRLLDNWRTRLRNFEYQKLVGLDYAKVDRAERYEFEELGQRGAPPRPGDMRPGDVLVRVPMNMPRTGETLFGDVMVFLFRRTEGQLKIAGVGEEMSP